MPDHGTAGHLAHRLVTALGRDGAHRAVDVLATKLSTTELAALATYWPLWAMACQLPPPGGWRSWTRLGARGTGKTLGFAMFVNIEVDAGRADLVGLAAQNEEKTLNVQVHGPSGLIATAPPWNTPSWHATSKTLRWPNGARAYALTPEAPGGIRGVDYHLSWLSELQSWPVATREEAFTNFMITTRLGYARTIIDATPKRRHPILRELARRAEDEPDKHIITTGTIHQNPFLGRGVIEDLVRQIGLQTVRGREELLGEMVDDADSMFREEWIARTRRPMPAELVRRVIACDPAITSDPRYSDRSGIVDGGVCPDGQLYTIANLTAHHPPEALGGVLVDAYVAGDCDLLIVETNRGGEAHVALVRVAARARGLEVEVLKADEKRTRRPGTVFVRPVNNRGRKVQRLEVAAALTERGSVSFVVGGKNLDELAEQLYGIEPAEKGPNDAADAFAMLCSELADATRPLPVDQLEGLAELTRAALGTRPEALERPSPLIQAMGLDPSTTRRRLPTMGRKRLL